jgi:hypothetical protein
MANYQRSPGHEDDVGFIPLMTVNERGQDHTDSHLPTYSEALDGSDQENQRTRQTRAQEQARRTHAQQAIASVLASESQRDQLRRALRGAKRRLVWVMLGLGIGLIIVTALMYHYLPKLG